MTYDRPILKVSSPKRKARIMLTFTCDSRPPGEGCVRFVAASPDGNFVACATHLWFVRPTDEEITLGDWPTFSNKGGWVDSATSPTGPTGYGSYNQRTIDFIQHQFSDVAEVAYFLEKPWKWEAEFAAFLVGGGGA